MDDTMRNYHRVKIFKLVNGDEVMANLVLEDRDFKGTPFGRSRLVDRITGKPSVLVSFPLRVFNQYDVNKNQVTTILLKWVHQSDSGLFMIPVADILTMSSVDDEHMNRYRDFLSNPPPVKDMPSDINLKLLCPEHPETH